MVIGHPNWQKIMDQMITDNKIQDTLLGQCAEFSWDLAQTGSSKNAINMDEAFYLFGDYCLLV